MKKIDIKQKRKLQRAKKTRVKILGYASRPRLSVFRSNKHLFLQIIDDQKGVTVVSVSDVKTKDGAKKRVDIAFELGKAIAVNAQEQKVKKVVFDRGPYAYHGIIKAVAEGAREGGLDF